MAEEKFVGVDVAKEQLQVAVAPGGGSWSMAYTDEAVAELARKLQADGPKLRIPVQSDRGFRSKVTVDSGPK